MIIALDLLVALAGVLLFALCANSKLQEIGRIAFFCGLLAFLMTGGGAMVNLLRR
jgi:Na+/phosphate symporter